MNLTFAFFFNSLLLGAGLAMDAFSVSLANGLNEPFMKRTKHIGIAGIFSFFQFLMPLIGWICISTIAQRFKEFEKFIPWIALFLLCGIGINMIFESLKNNNSNEEKPSVGFGALLLQGLATSIDALSVGFTISDYVLAEALLACLIIGLVTFLICSIGISLGKIAGTRFAGKANILGGTILILIGIEIFVKSFL